MNYRDEAWLRKKYWDEKLTLYEIATLVGKSQSTIFNWLKKYGIRRRNRSEFMRGKKLSPEHRQKIGEANRGRKQTPETRHKLSEANLGDKSYLWKGGRMKSTRGYIQIYAPNHPYARDRHVLEHRLKAEEAIGRYLKPGEYVHHINGTRDDNRLENLRIVNHHGETVCPHCGWPMGNLQEYVAQKGRGDDLSG